MTVGRGVGLDFPALSDIMCPLRSPRRYKKYRHDEKENLKSQRPEQVASPNVPLSLTQFDADKDLNELLAEMNDNDDVQSVASLPK